MQYEKTSKKRRQLPFFIGIPGKNLVQSFFLKQNVFYLLQSNSVEYTSPIPYLYTPSILRFKIYTDSMSSMNNSTCLRIHSHTAHIYFSNSWKFMRFGIHSHGNSWVYKFTFIAVHGFQIHIHRYSWISVKIHMTCMTRMNPIFSWAVWIWSREIIPIRKFHIHRKGPLSPDS